MEAIGNNIDNMLEHIADFTAWPSYYQNSRSDAISTLDLFFIRKKVQDAGQTSKDVGVNVEGDLEAEEILHTFADEISENRLRLSNPNKLDCIQLALFLHCQTTET